tara:strand:+ start:511 stop:852 length:342 start_codon:yes stop_codon:yes gene_type:complete
MRLYEFANTDPLVPKLIAVADQLKSELEDASIADGMSVDKFLEYLQKYDIVIDKIDLYNMIKKPPLDHIIDNIQGDEMVFKGQESAVDAAAPDPEKKVVKAMADKARKHSGIK